MRTRFILTILITCVVFLSARAATRIWDGGGTSFFWNNPTNWVGDVAPASGDDLVFPAGAARLVNSNNFAAGTTFNSITFSGPGYSISGNPIILNGSLTNAGHTINFASGAFSITGVIRGSGGLQSSATQLLLDATNTYTGATVINGGFLIIRTGSALGTVGAGTTVHSAGRLVLDNNITVPEPITLSGTLRNVLGTNTMTGNIVLATNATVEVLTNTTVILSNVLSGVGGVLKTGPGTLKFAGYSPNTYADATEVNGGTLLLGKTAGIAGVPSALFIGDGTGGPNSDVVRLEANSQIPDSSPVTINSSGMFDTDGFTEIVGELSGSGNLQLDTSIFSVNFSGAEVEFDGIISGSGSLVRNGSGTWILNGSNSYSGSLSANGNVFINGTLFASLISVSGTLGGTGTVGRVSLNASGTLSPGASAGQLTTSNLTFIVTSKYRVELNGTNPGSGYDQLKVKGTINNLASATLQATLGFPSAISNVFTIIDNDGTDAVTNTFLGLPEGATVNISGTPFRISYIGGDGNDVVLTQITATQQPFLNIQAASQTNVVLSWTTNFTGYTLEANTNLSTNVWAAVTNSPVVSGTNNFVTNATIGTQKFYRLRNP